MSYLGACYFQNIKQIKLTCPLRKIIEAIDIKQEFFQRFILIFTIRYFIRTDKLTKHS